MAESKELNWPHTGAVLAGGNSSRMGKPKEGILLQDGHKMIEHAISTLSPLCKNVVIIGKCEGYKTSNITVIPDKRPELGPLEGIETLLTSNLDTEYLVVACDQPFLTKDLLLRLVTSKSSSLIRLFGTGNRKDRETNSFPGYYSGKLLSHVQDCIQKNKLAMYTMIKSCKDVEWISISEKERLLLKSINTPCDLEEALNETH